MKDIFWMTKAYEFALKAKEEEEVPVGAVLIDSNENLLGWGWNQVMQTRNPCAHAELIAIQKAALTWNNHRLLDTTLYVTLEPCSMCAGALVHARVKRLVFASRDFKAGAAGSVHNVLNRRIQIDEGIMEKQCTDLLVNFFKVRR